MPLRAQYDAREDRMRLTLNPVDAAPRSYWVTRRQWLELMHALTRASRSAGSDEAPTPPKPPPGRTAPVVDATPAATLEAIRLRKTSSGLRVGFVAGAQSATVDLPNDGARKLLDMLQQQSERSGWDPQAALVRLQARDIAGATLHKAKGPR